MNVSDMITDASVRSLCGSGARMASSAGSLILDLCAFVTCVLCIGVNVCFLRLGMLP